MNILVVEDDKRVADLIKRGLEEQDYTVQLANNGLTGKLLATAQEYDVIILDIILPDISGIVVCKEIRSTRPDTQIIMLTALGTTDDKVDGLDAGADDYLVKPFDFRELEARIRALTKRREKRNIVTATVLRIADLELNLDTFTATRAGKEIPLTPKEFKLLLFMMQHSGRVVTRNEIAEKVWETAFDTGTNFIDVYINYLRRKIDKEHAIKLIHTRPGIGFILKPDNE